jgi:hypothetical protein
MSRVLYQQLAFDQKFILWGVGVDMPAVLHFRVNDELNLISLMRGCIVEIGF